MTRCFMPRRLSKERSQVTAPYRLKMRVHRSKQSHLLTLWRAEQVGAERELGLTKPESLAGNFKASAKQISPRALPAHSGEEFRVVVAAVAKGLNRCHHLGSAIWIMIVEPGAEQ